MKEQAPAYLPIQFLENLESSSVLAKFHLNNQQFFVIRLKSKSDTCLASALSTYELNRYTELERFDIQGHPCAIVKFNQSDPPAETDLVSLLTQRELQIAMLVALGRANKQIANQLHISEWTVSTHLRRIFIKLGVDSRAAMVYRCAPLIQQLFSQAEGAVED